MSVPKLPAPLLWTVARAAEELSISEGHLYRLVKQKRVPFVRVESSVRFSPAALQKWLQDKQIEAVR